MLDSYDIERRPVGAEVIAAAGRLTKVAALRNPIAQHIRNLIGHFVLGLAPVQRALEGSMTDVSIGPTLHRPRARKAGGSIAN